MGAAACLCPASSCSHISGNVFEVWSPFLSLLGLGGLQCSHSQLAGSAWLESHPGQPLQQCLLLLFTAPPAGRSRTLSLHNLVPFEEARPAPTAADPKNSGNKGVRNQIRPGTLEPKVSGTLIASVSTDGGPPKYSPGCCQDHTSVATFPSRPSQVSLPTPQVPRSASFLYA